MDANQVARDNHAFFYVAVGQSMCEEVFAVAILHSFDEPAQYGIESDNFSGYIRIDSTDIKKNCTHENFANAMRQGICGDVAMRIPRSLTGEMNTEVVVTHGIYKFSFKISKYERDSNHDFEEVEDPLSLPDGERLGRFVELKITIAQ